MLAGQFLPAQEPAAPAESEPATTRTWTDSTNTFRIEAKLVKVVDGTLHLERTDSGKIIQIPLAKLSAADIAFVQGTSAPAAGQEGTPATGDEPRATILTASQLENVAKRQRTARTALAVYGLFLADARVPQTEKDKAQPQFEHWRNAAEQLLVRVGTSWITPERLQELETEEARLFDEALQFYKAGTNDSAAKRFREASRVLPESIRADFRLGLLAALGERDVDTAASSFEACVARRMQRRDELSNAELTNLAAALNNLAIIDVRQRKYGTALGRWSQVLELSPASPEVIQNLGRLGYLSRADIRDKLGTKAMVNLPNNEQRRWENLYAVALRLNKGQEFDPKTGWLYISDVRETKREETPPGAPTTPVPARDFPVGSDPSAKKRVTGAASGFVVAPGYILTNAHVAKTADGFHITTKDRPEERLSAKTHVISSRGDLDLAILHCPALRAPPVDFAFEPPTLSAEIRLLGYPLASEVESSLNVKRGSISALPPHAGAYGSLRDYQDYLRYDVLIDLASSGGPACDRFGRVIAVNTAVRLPQSVGGGYSAGVRSDLAVGFLLSNLKGVRGKWTSNATEPKTWDEVVEKVGAATVRIQMLQDTNKVDINSPAAKAQRSKVKWDPMEDPWCMACHGSGSCPCPDRDCKQGRVLKYRTESGRLLDGSKITRQVPTRVACPTCDGTNRVRCRVCGNGIDPVFLID